MDTDNSSQISKLNENLKVFILIGQLGKVLCVEDWNQT